MSISADQIDQKLSNGYFSVNIVTRMYQGTKIDRETGNEVADNHGAKRSSVRGTIIALFADDRDELDACQRAFSRKAEVVKGHALLLQPGGPSTATNLLVSKNDWFFGDLATAMAQCEQACDAALDALCLALPRMIASSKAALGSMAPPDDEYPTEEFIRLKFANVVVGPNPAPCIAALDRASLPAEVLDTIADDMLAAREEQITNSLKDALTKKQDELLDNLRRMATTMTKVRDGEKTSIYATLTTNLQETVRGLRANNLFESERLERVCDAIDSLCAKPAKAYKKTPEAAGKLADAAKRITHVLENHEILW